MGLGTTHDCWSGSYTAFGEWRSEVFAAAFGGSAEPKYAYVDVIESWPADDSRRADSLMELLLHSDCDGSIPHNRALVIASRLHQVLDHMPDFWKPVTAQFISGLGRAYAAGEDLEFH